MSHHGLNRVLDLAPESSLEISALAWYTDVKSEYLPVSSGYRLALSYNLLQTTGGVIPTFPDSETWSEKLRNVLKLWKDSSDANPGSREVLAYALHHKTDPAGIIGGIESLIGADAQEFSKLRPLAEELGYTLFLGNLTCVVSGKSTMDWMEQMREKRRVPNYNIDDYYQRFEEHNRSYSVSDIVGMDGSKSLDPGQKVAMGGKNDVVPLHLFDGIKPDEQKREDVCFHFLSKVMSL